MGEYKYTKEHFNSIHAEVIMSVTCAVVKQNVKRDNPSYPPGIWLSILGEEFGEVCQALQVDEPWSKDTDKDNL